MHEGYKKHLDSIPVARTHNGYFSIDKKSKRMVDPVTGKKSTETDDVDAYDLILKDKERLLSFDEPTRFIFSHSALREGWDNPNVFVICTLKHSDNTISRRLEDLDVPRKMRRLRQWCEDVNVVQSEVDYDFVYVDEEGFEKYEPKFFAALLSGFREYKETRR